MKAKVQNCQVRSIEKKIKFHPVILGFAKEIQKHWVFSDLAGLIAELIRKEHDRIRRIAIARALTEKELAYCIKEDLPLIVFAERKGLKV